MERQVEQRCNLMMEIDEIEMMDEKVEKSYYSRDECEKRNEDELESET